MDSWSNQIPALSICALIIFDVNSNIFEPTTYHMNMTSLRFVEGLGASNRGKDVGSARTGPADEKQGLSLLAHRFFSCPIATIHTLDSSVNTPLARWKTS